MIEGLLDYGFTKDEAEAYLFLLKAGPCPARVVARKLGTNRMKAYRTLKSLEEKGLVEVIIGRPVKFVATPLKEALEQYTERLRKEVSGLEKTGKEIMEDWKKSYSRVDSLTEEPKFRIFQGRQQVYNLLSQMFERPKAEILLFTTKNDLYRLSFTDIYDKLKSLYGKGVKIRVITQIDQSGLELVENYMGFAEVHHVDALRTKRFVIINGSEAITSFAMDDSMSMTTQRDTGLWTDAYSYVDATKTFFYNLWRATPDAREVVNAIKTGRSPQEIRMIGTQEEYARTYEGMAESSKEEVIIMTKRIRSLPINVQDFQSMSERGVKIRLLTQVDLDGLSETNQILKLAQVMHDATVTNLRMFIVDRREVLLHIPYLGAMGQPLWSNLKAYVDTMVQVFEDHWISGVPAQEILPKLANQQVLTEGLELARKTLEKTGWEVQAPGKLAGDSGLEHSFSLVAKRLDRPDKPLALDLLTEQNALGQIVKLSAKVMDAKPMVQLLAATRPFEKEDTKLAGLYGIRLIHAAEAQQLATEIMDEAKRTL